MRIHLFTVSISVLTVFFLFNPSLHAGINFPQKEYSFSITGAQHIQIQKYFSPLWELPEEFDSTIANLLLQSLPKAFDTGNKKMIMQWGRPALKGATKAVRTLYMKNFNPTHQQILLSYIWFSSTSGFGDKYYDERVALLTILDTVSRVTVFPTVNPCDKCPDLTHIGFGDELQISGRLAISLFFNISNVNPCCDTSKVRDETYVKYYFLTPQDMKECFMLLQERTERFHHKNGSDSSASYTATISFDKDSNENIRKIFFDYSKLSNDQVIEKQVQTYIWNGKKNTFEPVLR
jgi:hypothetical protein